MRFLLKIVFAPAIAVLAVLIWLCGLTLKLSAWVFGIIGTILGILGLAILLLDSTTNGVIVLVIAFCRLYAHRQKTHPQSYLLELDHG